MIATLAGPVRRTVAGLSALLALVVLAVLVLRSERAPNPVPATAPAQEFSAQRALGPLQELVTGPRPLGSAASDRVRDQLAGALRAAGFSVQISRDVGAYSAEGRVGFGRVDNIVATLPGRDPTGSVVLAAHYDSVPAGPGASDDGAALAAMLETVRALGSDAPGSKSPGSNAPGSGGPLRNDLVLLITDGEEDGLLGASAFARQHPLARDRAVVLNWEARGVSGPSLMFETSRNNAALVKLFATAAPHPHGDSSMVEFYRLLPNNTDFTEFAAAGMTGMNFAYIQGAARYHTPGDSIANLDLASLQHQGANMVGLTRALGAADLATLSADHDAVYFPALGPVITYSFALVWPLALLAALMLGALVVCARRLGLPRRLGIPRLLLGAASVLLPLAVAAGMAQGLWWVLLELRPDYAAKPFVYRPQLYQGAVAVLAGFALVCWYLPLRRRLGPAALACGGLGWLVALGVLAAWRAPGASHLFALPALGCALGGLLAVLLRKRSGWPVLMLTAGPVPAVLLLLPLGVGTFDAGLAQGGAAAALLALFGLTLVPIFELLLPPPEQSLGAGRALALPVAAVLLVLALTGAGLAVDRIDPAHPRRTDLNYLLDTDTGRAHWVSRDAEPAEWTRRYVRDRGPDPLGEADGSGNGQAWLGPAAVLPVPAPGVTVRSHRGNELTLHVSSPRSAGTVVLRVDHRVDQVTLTAAGLAPATRAVRGTLPGRWPTEIIVGDPPGDGVDVTLRVPVPGVPTPGVPPRGVPPRGVPLTIVCLDQSYGLSGLPGFVPRPAGLEQGPGSSSDRVLVQRTYRF